MAILSEAYSNDPFPARITSTYAFVQEVLTLAAAERSTIRRLVAASAQLRPDSVAVRSILAPPTEQPVIAEITTPEGDGDGPFARRKRTGEFRHRMPVYDRFVASRARSATGGRTGSRLTARRRGAAGSPGRQVEQPRRNGRGRRERFRIDRSIALPASRTPTVTVEGAARPSHDAAGGYLVRTDQPGAGELPAGAGVRGWRRHLELRRPTASRCAHLRSSRVRVPVRATVEQH
jgi:hypothetical protein